MSGEGKQEKVKYEMLVVVVVVVAMMMMNRSDCIFSLCVKVHKKYRSIHPFRIGRKPELSLGFLMLRKTSSCVGLLPCA